MKPFVILAAAFVLALPFAVRADEAALARAHLAASDGEWREALGWFEIAAEDGDVGAKETVASMYLNGETVFPGIERNVALARAWYYRAEAQGSVIATRMLAQLEGAPVGAVAAVPDAQPTR
jgi:TPR repeat protein